MFYELTHLHSNSLFIFLPIPQALIATMTAIDNNHFNIYLLLTLSASILDSFNVMVVCGGLMEVSHNYFERVNFDIFSGKGPYLSTLICALNHTFDDSDPHHDWYINYIKVTSIGIHTACAQT
uniref:Uncharacterized protein n=1 Tax=Kalanchoe fedtschenkoi TaxID=63787 RepID=A0A7N0UQ56_KALFE